MAREVAINVSVNGSKQAVKTIGELETAVEQLRTELKQVEVGSEEFKKLSGELQNAESKLKTLNKTFEGLEPQAKADAYIKLGTGIAGAFAVATAAVSLFGSESEDAAETTLAVQEALTIAIGFREVAEARLQAQIIATDIAQKALNASTATGSKILRAFYALIAANPVTAIVGAISALVAAYVLLKNSTDEAAEAQREFDKQVDESAGKSIAQLDLLNATINDTTQSTEDRKKAIDELRSIFPAYFQGLEDEKILNGEVVIEIDKLSEALLRQARVRALTTQLEALGSEEYQNARELNKLLEERDDILDANGITLLKFLEALASGSISAAFATGDVGAVQGEIEKRTERTNEIAQEQADIIQMILDLNKQNSDIIGDTNDGLEEGERLLAAQLANEKRRLDLITNEYIKRLATLRFNYEQELKAAEKNGEDVELVEKKYYLQRAQLLKEFNQAYINFTNQLYVDIGAITGEYYDAQEEAIRVAGEDRMEQLEIFQEAELSLLKEGSDEYNQTLIEQAKDRENLQRLIELQVENLRMTIRQQGLEALYDLEEQAGQENLELQIELYNAEFEAYRQTQEAKIRLAGEAEGLTEEQIQAQIDSFNELAESVRARGEQEIKTNSEVAAARKKADAENLDAEEIYLKERLRLSERYEGDPETRQQKLAQLDAQYKAQAIQREIKFLQQKLEILSKDPTMNPEEYQRIQNEILKLQQDYSNEKININKQEADENSYTFEDYVRDFQRSAQLSVQVFQQYLQTTLMLLQEQEKRVLDQIVGDNEDAEIKRTEAREFYENKRKEITKQSQLAQLELTRLQAIAEAALAVNKAYAQFGAAGFGPAALLAAIGAAQVLVISQQINAVRNLARGGLLDGPSHEYGGIPLAGGGVVAEGGEAVINRQGSINYRGLLNEVSMSSGGAPMVSSSFDDTRLIEAITKQNRDPIKAYVLEQDITRSQSVNKRLQQLSKI